jgi:hypothetical protein
MPTDPTDTLTVTNVNGATGTITVTSTPPTPINETVWVSSTWDAPPAELSPGLSMILQDMRASLIPEGERNVPRVTRARAAPVPVKAPTQKQLRDLSKFKFVKAQKVKSLETVPGIDHATGKRYAALSKEGEYEFVKYIQDWMGGVLAVVLDSKGRRFNVNEASLEKPCINRKLPGWF